MPRDVDGKQLTRKFAETAASGAVEDLTTLTSFPFHEGWSSDYWPPGTGTISGPVVNAILRRISAVGVEINEYGILEWDAELTYAQHAIVQHNGVLYQSLQNTVSNPNLNQLPTVANSAYWRVLIPDRASFIWSSTVAYVVNDIVIASDGEIYQAVRANTRANPTTSAADWKRFRPLRNQESGNIPIGVPTTTAHTLGAEPTGFDFALVCTTAAGGFDVGDKVYFPEGGPSVQVYDVTSSEYKTLITAGDGSVSAATQVENLLIGLHGAHTGTTSDVFFLNSASPNSKTAPYGERDTEINFRVWGSVIIGGNWYVGDQNRHIRRVNPNNFSDVTDLGQLPPRFTNGIYGMTAIGTTMYILESAVERAVAIWSLSSPYTASTATKVADFPNPIELGQGFTIAFGGIAALGMHLWTGYVRRSGRWTGASAARMYRWNPGESDTFTRPTGAAAVVDLPGNRGSPGPPGPSQDNTAWYPPQVRAMASAGSVIKVYLETRSPAYRTPGENPREIDTARIFDFNGTTFTSPGVRMDGVYEDLTALAFAGSPSGVYALSEVGLSNFAGRINARF